MHIMYLHYYNTTAYKQKKTYRKENLFHVSAKNNVLVTKCYSFMLRNAISDGMKESVAVWQTLQTSYSLGDGAESPHNQPPPLQGGSCPKLRPNNQICFLPTKFQSFWLKCFSLSFFGSDVYKIFILSRILKRDENSNTLPVLFNWPSFNIKDSFSSTY